MRRSLAHIKRLITAPKCRPMPAMQRRGTAHVVRVSSDHQEEADAGFKPPSARDFAWFRCGCYLTLGGLLPSLLACYFYKEVKEQIITM